MSRFFRRLKRKILRIFYQTCVFGSMEKQRAVVEDLEDEDHTSQVGSLQTPLRPF
ncbi:hypothetical protein Bca4012_032673 [Brassica carinata]